MYVMYVTSDNFSDVIINTCMVNLESAAILKWQLTKLHSKNKSCEITVIFSGDPYNSNLSF